MRISQAFSLFKVAPSIPVEIFLEYVFGNQVRGASLATWRTGLDRLPIRPLPSPPLLKPQHRPNRETPERALPAVAFNDSPINWGGGGSLAT